MEKLGKGRPGRSEGWRGLAAGRLGPSPMERGLAGV